MEPKYRIIWADLYRFFEQCAKKDADLPELGKEANRIHDEHGQDVFVREVLAVTLAYWHMKKGEKDGPQETA